MTLWYSEWTDQSERNTSRSSSRYFNLCLNSVFLSFDLKNKIASKKTHFEKTVTHKTHLDPQKVRTCTAHPLTPQQQPNQTWISTCYLFIAIYCATWEYWERTVRHWEVLLFPFTFECMCMCVFCETSQGGIFRPIFREGEKDRQVERGQDWSSTYGTDVTALKRWATLLLIIYRCSIQRLNSHHRESRPPLHWSSHEDSQRHRKSGVRAVKPRGGGIWWPEGKRVCVRARDGERAH